MSFKITSVMKKIIFFLFFLLVIYSVHSQDNFIFDQWVTISSKTFSINKKIPIGHKWNHTYISLNDFSQCMYLGIYTNEQRHKTVLYLVKDRITFTGNNTYVIVNDEIIQITVECIWEDGKVWVSVEHFVDIINDYTNFSMIYNEQESRIDFEKSDINISRVELIAKENGMLIHVYALHRFDPKVINFAIRNGWFHIDIYGAKIDTNSISATSGSGIIHKVQGIQLGETASIAFKLKSEIVSWDPVFSDDSNDFFVNLRFNSEVTSSITGRESALSGKEQLRKELAEQKKKSFINTIVLDAGHGGKDPGAIGYKKILEKNIVLPVTLKLGELIKKEIPDMKVIFTRSKDVFIPLWERTKVANEENSKIFVSIHANWNYNKKVNGCETYFLSADKDEQAKDVVMKENSVIKEFEAMDDLEKYREGNLNILATMTQSRVIRQSQYLASLIQESLKNNLDKTGITSNGVKQGPFWVLVGATMPNVLVEIGYLSNKDESMLLKKSSIQQKIAEAIFQGIKKFKEDIESAI
jgi:N-acetylmuramoyl-L-alanine amidase